MQLQCFNGEKMIAIQKHFLFIIMFISCHILFLAYLPAKAETMRPILWFAPRASGDFKNLFKAESQWGAVLSKLNVFKLYPAFVTHANDDDFDIVIKFLVSHNIKIGLEAGVLRASDSCGRNVEGYGGQYLSDMAKRIQRAGGQLSYLSMDEPLWYGRHYSGPRACRAEVKEIARNAAAEISEFHRLFPDVIIGDIEPVTVPEVENWMEELDEWIREFRKMSAIPIKFLHADVNWDKSWQGGLVSAEKVATNNGVLFGVIINGKASDKTDEDWSVHAIKSAKDVERLVVVNLNALIFQTWTQLPSRFLPESDKNTLTGIVKSYIKAD